MEIQLLTFNGPPLMPSSEVSSLGVALDTSLSMEAQVTMTARIAFYHLRLVKLLVPYLDSHDLAIMIHAMITSKLHYCNPLYVGSPLNPIWKLQLVQNAVDCVLTVSPLQTHIQPVQLVEHKAVQCVGA